MMSVEATAGVVDCDGHVIEDVPAIVARLPRRYSSNLPSGFGTPIFPPLDHLHGQPAVRHIEGRSGIGVAEWRSFQEEVGISTSVLYPTKALSYGKIPNPTWASELCRAYNDWVHETYHLAGHEFAAMGIVPLQDPPAAAAELHRVVTELGMPGAILPARGTGLHSLSSSFFEPVYEAASELRCCLAIHGGCHDGIGLDDMRELYAVHALGHPIVQMIALTGLVTSGAFDRYEGMRLAFLEAGSAWLLVLLERLDESRGAMGPVEPRLELDPGQSVADYVIGQLQAGRIVLGCEGGESELESVTRLAGICPFMYASDFPHEVTAETCLHEMHELEEKSLSEADRRAILGGNASAFYGLSV